MGRVGVGLGGFAVASMVLAASGAGGARATEEDWQQVFNQYPRLRPLLQARARGIQNQTALPPAQLRAFELLGTPGTRGFHPQRAIEYLNTVQRSQQYLNQTGGNPFSLAPFLNVEGEAALEILLSGSPELLSLLGARKRNKVKVPLNQVGGGQRPTSRGKAKTQRRGGD